jgi:hydrogenase expression/formation protein HypC
VSEDPGIAAPRGRAGSDGAPPCDHDGCITCGDLATPMRVVEVDDAGGLAVCVDAERRRELVDTGVVGAVATGDTLLVHAGTALHREPA